MTCCGRLFHTRDAVTRNDRSPMVVSRVRQTTSIDDDAERSLHRTRESAGRLSSSASYGGADPCTHLNTSTASLKSIRSFAYYVFYFIVVLCTRVMQSSAMLIFIRFYIIFAIFQTAVIHCF